MFDSWSFGVLKTSLWGGVGLNIDKSHYVIVLAILKHATEMNLVRGYFGQFQGSNVSLKGTICVIYSPLG